MASISIDFVAKVVPTVLILLGSGSAGGEVDIVRDCMISMSDNSRYMAIGNKSSFFLLYLDEGAGEYRLLSRVSGVQSVGESITSLCCFDAGALIRSSDNKDLVFTAVGYSNGTISIFNKKGKLIQSQLFHPTSVVFVAVRLTFSKRIELLVYHDGFCIIAVDLNESILSKLKSLPDDSREPMMWEHKKWRLAVPTTEMSPASISCLGPLTESEERKAISIYRNCALNRIAAPDSSSLLYPTHAVNRFLCIGTSSPELSIHFAENSPYLLASATKLASMVTSSISSFAKSMMFSSDSPTTLDTPANIAPPTSVPATFQFKDPSRKFTDCSVAPRNYQISALSDSFGRVWLLDTLNCEFIRMWKGIRDAQCSWLELEDGENVQLILVVYAPKRSLLQAFKMRRGQLLASTGLEVKNCSFFTCNYYSGFAETLIIKDDGSVHRVKIDTETAET